LPDGFDIDATHKLIEIGPKNDFGVVKIRTKRHDHGWFLSAFHE
jgi:hypothetical protein